jgi:hypothetical protein
VGTRENTRPANHRASHAGYDRAVLMSGSPVGTNEGAPDLACGLYRGDPTA